MSRPSTRALDLPSPAVLERLSQSLAILDAILSPEWEDRYYSFDSGWDTTKKLRMGSMRNGCGDDYFILFSAAGVAIKGYAHEYPMAQPGNPPEGVLDRVPDDFADFLNEPAFNMSDTSFCVWHLTGGEWSVGPINRPDGDDPDGSEFLLALLTGNPVDYQNYARDYFEVEAPIEAITSIYRHEPLKDDLVRSLNNEISLADLAADLAEIGYPAAT